MKLGAERNKIIVLAVASTVAAGTVYLQFFAGEEATPTRRRPAAVTRSSAPERAPRQRRASAPPRQVRGQSFRPTFHRADSDEALDPMTVDPTLQTDLLAKVRSVEFEGIERNLFRFGERKKLVASPSAEEIKESQERLKALQAQSSKPVKKKPVARKPTAPPIDWKYYGFANSRRDTRKRAFLLDGEEIFIATEGDVFEKRYRIVRIGINSIVIEDMQFKEEQKLPLEES